MRVHPARPLNGGAAWAKSECRSSVDEANTASGAASTRAPLLGHANSRNNPSAVLLARVYSAVVPFNTEDGGESEERSRERQNLRQSSLSPPSEPKSSAAEATGWRSRQTQRRDGSRRRMRSARELHASSAFEPSLSSPLQEHPTAVEPSRPPHERARLEG
eukprot:scaffold159272_cov36-Tisochrysis_lutea.AAC.3